MLWLAGQVFLLCLVSFLVGAAVTAVALRRRPAPEPTAPRLQDVAAVPTAHTPDTDEADAVQAIELAEPDVVSPEAAEDPEAGRSRARN